MSYDIEIVDPETREVVRLAGKHELRGGTYAVGGTHDASLNMTYNYAPILARVLPEREVEGEPVSGIRTLYGMPVWGTVPLLLGAINALKSDDEPDYWKCTEGNVRRALENLLKLAGAVIAEGHFNAVWAGD